MWVTSLRPALGHAKIAIWDQNDISAPPRNFDGKYVNASYHRGGSDLDLFAKRKSKFEAVTSRWLKPNVSPWRIWFEVKHLFYQFPDIRFQRGLTLIWSTLNFLQSRNQSWPPCNVYTNTSWTRNFGIHIIMFSWVSQGSHVSLFSLVSP